MVANERKLDTLTSALTPKERAVLWLRAWCAGEAADYRLAHYCPSQDRAVFDRIVAAVKRGNSEIHGQVIILLEWLARTESEIHWLRIFDLHAAQVREMEKMTGKRAPKLPAPWNTDRQVAIGWGVLVDPDQPTARTWDEFREISWRDVKRSLELRWQDLAAFREVFNKVERVFGEPLVQREVGERLDCYEDSLTRLSGEFEGELDPSSPNPEKVAFLREMFGLDELADEHDPRATMHETVRATLTEFEQEQAELLSNRS